MIAWSERQIRDQWERSLAFAVGLFDSHGGVVFANRGMRALLQLTDATGNRAEYFQAPRFQRLCEAPESDQPIFEGLLTIGHPHAPGASLPAHVFHRDGQLLVVCEHDAEELQHTNRDLARLVDEVSALQRELIKERRQLTEANQRLAEINREKDFWVGVVAHDLRSPLTTIQLLVQLIEGQGAAPHIQRPLATIQRAVKNMVHLIDDLLDVAAIARGALRLVRHEVDLARFLASILAIQQPIAAAKSISLECERDVDARSGWFDARRIEQVLHNLISNAIKFSPPASRVRLEVRLRGGELEFIVSDEGSGIPADQLITAFGEFSITSTRPTGGEHSTGLGLAICQRIVALHGGTIEVTSTPGRGSRFCFRLSASGPTRSSQ